MGLLGLIGLGGGATGLSVAGGGGGPGITATGGDASWAYGGKTIRVWTSTGSGTPFAVSYVGGADNTIEYFVVGCGGGGGGDSE